MTETKKSTHSMWKKIKTAIKKFTVGKKALKATEAPKNDDISDDEAKITELEETWVSAAPYSGQYDRKSHIIAFLSKIEARTEIDSERIDIFAQEAKGEISQWWGQLTVKPQKWKDLRSWVIEDMDGIEGIKRLREGQTRNSNYY
ncbi:hypothetical protein NEAUS06_0512 [Nematocida ausubeli]|nr:hypothetical protein NEAUS06_0512 [Nematocida ausubeli]